jgi:hypothetical protein
VKLNPVLDIVLPNIYTLERDEIDHDRSGISNPERERERKL